MSTDFYNMKSKRIFLIAYYFRPYQGVGSLRPAYWFDLLRSEGVDVTLITAIPGEDEPGVIRLQVKKRNKLFAILGLDDSFSWGIQVKNYLLDNDLISEQDTILFTGGPFLQINIVRSLRKKYPLLNIIIDYRDPFACNPVFNDIWVKKFLKYQFEKRYNRNASTVIAVNQVCNELLVPPFYRSMIIDNGYDERLFGEVNVEDKDKEEIIYAGKFYLGTHPERFLNLFCQQSLKFKYCGSSELPVYWPELQRCGQLPYTEIVNLFKKASVGVLLIYGDPFQSTTKIFDYIGAKLKILIITNGTLHTGSIQYITENNPNVEWAKNEAEAIKNALIRLQTRDYQEWDHQQWSRYKGYCKLKTIL